MSDDDVYRCTSPLEQAIRALSVPKGSNIVHFPGPLWLQRQIPLPLPDPEGVMGKVVPISRGR
jgi:hypothetical protein